MTPLNLARRPFRNERLPTLLVGMAGLAVLALTAWHSVAVWRLLPRRTSALHEEVRALEKKLERFEAERRSARLPAPDARTLVRWTRVKELVDQRMFSWTDLFASLEEVIPYGVRLVGITPTIGKEGVTVALSAVVRSPDEGWEFVRVLEEHAEFDDVYPQSEGEGGVFEYKVRYQSSAPWRAARAAAAESRALLVESP